MSTPNRPPAALFIREDLSLLVVVGDQTLEIQLDDAVALELARDLITVTLSKARAEAAADLASRALQEAKNAATH